jgi:uncharacterized membrane protein (DUF485 family)
MRDSRSSRGPLRALARAARVRYHAFPALSHSPPHPEERAMPDPIPPGAADPAAADREHDWTAIEASPGFRELVASKRRFIVPATIFFIVYYFALPVLVGYFPEAMSRNVLGKINVAYLFALSQFAMAWVVMALYVRRARSFDAQEHAIVEQAGRSS